MRGERRGGARRPAECGRPLREVPPAAIALLKRFEGLKDGDTSTPGLDPYLCPAGVWTIGWGHAIRENGELLRGAANRDRAFALYPGGISLDQAELLLRQDAEAAARDVLSLVTVPLAEGQFAALISFVFNLGASRLRISTLRRKLNARHPGVADEFAKWVYARDARGHAVALEGLARRRKAERDLFVG